MNDSFILMTLLARGSRISDMGRRFRRGGSNVEPGQIVLFVSIIVAVIIAAVVANRILSVKNQPGYRSPKALFRDLCKLHRLNLKQRHLLSRLVRWQRLADPGRLFVEAYRYEESNLGPTLLVHREALWKIRDQVMG